MLLRFYIRSENRVHPGQVAFSIRLEPFDNIAIEAKVNGSLAARHDDAGTLPELRAERFSFRGIWAGLILAAFSHGSDLAKGVSHYSRFLVHLCSLSGRL